MKKFTLLPAVSAALGLLVVAACGGSSRVADTSYDYLGPDPNYYDYYDYYDAGYLDDGPYDDDWFFDYYEYGDTDYDYWDANPVGWEDWGHVF